jgi:uncharacterized integral membrane protein
MIRKLKWVVILLLLLYLVIFATANQQKLVIYYFYDKPLFGYQPVSQELKDLALQEGQPLPKPTVPREIPLIVVIFGSAILGVILSSLGGTIERFKYGSQLRQKHRELNSEKKRIKQAAKTREKEQRLKDKEEKQRKKDQKKLEKEQAKAGTKPQEPEAPESMNNKKKG